MRVGTLSTERRLLKKGSPFGSSGSTKYTVRVGLKSDDEKTVYLY